MIGRYNLGAFFSCQSNRYLIISTLASYPSTAKNSTWVRNEVRDRVISNYLIPSDFETIHWWWWSTLKVHHPICFIEPSLMTISITNRYRLLKMEMLHVNPWTIRSPLFCFEVDSAWCVNRSEVITLHSNFSFPFVKRCTFHLPLWADREENAT